MAIFNSYFDITRGYPTSSTKVTATQGQELSGQAWPTGPTGRTGSDVFLHTWQLPSTVSVVAERQVDFWSMLLRSEPVEVK